MSRYIDSEKLIAGVKELNLATKTYEEQVAFNNALAMVVEIITSLQQEQPEVEQDMVNVVKSYYDVQELEDVKITTTGVGLLNFAEHIKKIILNSAFILYNHITENSGNKTLDDEIDAVIKMNDLWGGLLPNTLIKYTSRHFWDMGLNARKEE